MKGIASPRFQVSPVETFTRDEIEALLKACLYAREADPWNRRRFVMRRTSAKVRESIKAYMPLNPFA